MDHAFVFLLQVPDHSCLHSLDEEEFKRALLFLRRAFSDFTPGEKADVAENLGEIWQVNKDQVSETVTRALKTEELEFPRVLKSYMGGDIYGTGR